MVFSCATLYGAFSLFAAIAGGVGRKSIVFTGKPTTRPQSHDIEKLWWALVLLSLERSYGSWNPPGLLSDIVLANPIPKKEYKHKHYLHVVSR